MVGVNLPDTQYVRSGELTIAYQTLGAGPIDLVFVPGLIAHVEFLHEIPGYTDCLRQLAAFARVVTFDRSGQGLSDRWFGMPSFEQRVDEISTVMGAAGSRRAVVLGCSEGGPISVMFAAMYPERVSHLILYGSFPRYIATDDYPFMPSKEGMLAAADFWAQHWGTGVSMFGMLPSREAEPDARTQFAKLERLSFSPGALKLMFQYNMELDVRSVLSAVRVPTLVLHRQTDALIKIENSQFLAAQIPGAKLIEYSGCSDHLLFGGDWHSICGDIEQFVTGRRGEVIASETERVLATVLFTDIVDSTVRASSPGDQLWRRVLDEHDRTANDLVAQYRGRLIKTTGDGILAMFDGPGRAIRCALALSSAVARMGLQLRAGLHTGEIEIRGSDIAGIGVNAAARVMALCAPGEVLVSRVVTDLVAGAGLCFSERGTHDLKGLSGRWELFAAGTG